MSIRTISKNQICFVNKDGTIGDSFNPSYIVSISEKLCHQTPVKKSKRFNIGQENDRTEPHWNTYVQMTVGKPIVLDGRYEQAILHSISDISTYYR